MNGNAASTSDSAVSNGGALAAVFAAGIGALAMGAFVVLNEGGLFTAPSLYAPAGGLSGRSTLAVGVWAIAWGILHVRWRARELPVRRVLKWAVVLVALGLVMTFPPLWGLP